MNTMPTRRGTITRAMLMTLACALVSVEGRQALGGMIVHFSGRIHQIHSGLGDPIHQYLAVNDQFEGSFLYDPTAAGTALTDPALSSGQQYNSAITGFTVKFRTGQSSGQLISGVVSSRDDYIVPVTSGMALANNALYGGQGPLDVARGMFALPDEEFRPGLTPVFFAYDLMSGVITSFLDSDALIQWDPTQVFGGGSAIIQDNYLVFQTANGTPQVTTFRFTGFRGEVYSEVTPQEEQAAIDDENTAATFFGGTEGSSTPGGLHVQFGDAPENDGEFVASYATYTATSLMETLSQAEGFDLGNFVTGANGQYQLWELDFTGELGDGSGVTLQFRYDDTGLSENDEANLGIWHYGKYGSDGSRQWKWLRDEIDTAGNVITVTVDHFSPLIPGFQPIQAVPEPASLGIWSLLVGLPVLFARRRNIQISKRLKAGS